MSELEIAAPTAPSAPPPAPPAEVLTDQNPADQATAATPPVEKTETTDEQPAKQGQSRFERRLNKIYRKFGEEKARADFLQKQLDEVKAPKAPPQEGTPRLEQFDDIEKYAEAKAEFAKSQALKDYEAKQRTTTQQQQQQRIVASWEEKATAAESKYDDFEEIVGEIHPTNPLAVAIMREEHGADVAYYLGKHPKEAMRIAGLEPIDQILAVGRLSQKLSSEPPVAKQPSKAPPPITPVSGKAAVQSDVLTGDEDMKTFIRIRERQLGRKK